MGIIRRIFVWVYCPTTYTWQIDFSSKKIDGLRIYYRSTNNFPASGYYEWYRHGLISTWGQINQQIISSDISREYCCITTSLSLRYTYKGEANGQKLPLIILRLPSTLQIFWKLLWGLLIFTLLIKFECPDSWSWRVSYSYT